MLVSTLALVLNCLGFFLVCVLDLKGWYNIKTNKNWIRNLGFCCKPIWENILSCSESTKQNVVTKNMHILGRFGVGQPILPVLLYKDDSNADMLDDIQSTLTFP